MPPRVGARDACAEPGGRSESAEMLRMQRADWWRGMAAHGRLAVAVCITSTAGAAQNVSSVGMIDAAACGDARCVH